MTDKIEIGEYVRTNKGYIAKFKQYLENTGTYMFDNVIQDIDDNKYKYISENELKKVMIKHNKNIIDLVEKDDYVNGRLVLQVDYKNKNVCLLIPFTDTKANTNIMWYGYEDIRTVVTKEQFEKTKYKVVE